MDPLANLNDIAEPAAVGIWPLALGWWLAIALCLLVAVLIWIKIVKSSKRNAARRIALESLSIQYQSNELTVSSANELIKRTCLSYGNRNSIASLHGQAWVEFLYATLKPSSKNEELKTQLVAFEQSLYQKESKIDALRLFNVTRSWLYQADFDRLEQITQEIDYV